MLAMTASTFEQWSLSAFASCYFYSFITVHVVSVLLVILRVRGESHRPRAKGRKGEIKYTKLNEIGYTVTQNL